MIKDKIQDFQTKNKTQNNNKIYLNSNKKQHNNK
jgi:hypothetical protein